LKCVCDDLIGKRVILNTHSISEGFLIAYFFAPLDFAKSCRPEAIMDSTFRKVRRFVFKSYVNAGLGFKGNIGFEINSPLAVVEHFSAMISVGIKIGHGDGNFLIMALTGSFFRLILHLKAPMIAFGPIIDAYRIDGSQIPEIFKKYRVLQRD
jgi:hypothetical protein